MSKDASSQSAAQVRIVVAEDEALIRMDLIEMLQEAGYSVVAEATNGAGHRFSSRTSTRFSDS